jgi:hypothetical protein
MIDLDGVGGGFGKQAHGRRLRGLILASQ